MLQCRKFLFHVNDSFFIYFRIIFYTFSYLGMIVLHPKFSFLFHNIQPGAKEKHYFAVDVYVYILHYYIQEQYTQSLEREKLFDILIIILFCRDCTFFCLLFFVCYVGSYIFFILLASLLEAIFTYN